MSGTKGADAFRHRMTAMLYLASQYPAWVGTQELKPIMNVDLRSVQRMMVELAEIGYLERKEGMPLGYRIRPESLNAFRRL